MKYCEKCKVNVRGNLHKCPLCQNALKGEPDGELFPVIPSIFKQFELVFKLLILLSVTSGVCSAAVNLIISGKFTWSPFVLFGIACFWISLFVAIRNRHAIPSNITQQVVIVCALSVLWDFLTGKGGWSYNYVIPIVCTVAVVSLITLSRVTKMEESECAVSLVINILLGIVPLVLFLTDKLTVLIPSMICISMSIISLVMLILFEGKILLQELKRKFHV